MTATPSFSSTVARARDFSAYFGRIVGAKNIVTCVFVVVVADGLKRLFAGLLTRRPDTLYECPQYVP